MYTTGWGGGASYIENYTGVTLDSVKNSVFSYEWIVSSSSVTIMLMEYMMEVVSVSSGTTVPIIFFQVPPPLSLIMNLHFYFNNGAMFFPGVIFFIHTKSDY